MSTYTVTLIHCAVTWGLVGLIWTVQLVIYPQFQRVGKESFGSYHGAHMFRIGCVVAPLMILEAGTAAWLVLYLGEGSWWMLGSLLFLATNWLSTALIQVPQHTRLEMGGFDPALVDRLIRSNWIRTFAWTARGMMVLACLLDYPQMTE